jgi:hypothetical protein
MVLVLQLATCQLRKAFYFYLPDEKCFLVASFTPYSASVGNIGDLSVLLCQQQRGWVKTALRI